MTPPQNKICRPASNSHNNAKLSIIVPNHRKIIMENREISKLAEKATSSLLPERSGQRYEKEYSEFVRWCSSKNVFVDAVNEDVLLAYFEDRFNGKKSLWCYYSMLKSTLSIKHNISIDRFPKLIAYLKRKTVGQKPKKSEVFTPIEIDSFMKDASDDTYLLMKVVLTIGIAGACRREELTKMEMRNIKEEGSLLVVTIPDSKNHTTRKFVVCERAREIYRKYVLLRPAGISHDRLFIFYKNGKCSSQAVGINTIGKIPSKIAEYLKLKEPKNYTGHCFRRTSATLLADAGGDILDLKRHGGWKSSTVAEGYIEESIGSKIIIANKISGSSDCSVGLSVERRPHKETPDVTPPETNIPTKKPLQSAVVNVGNVSNSTITINF